MIHFYKTINKVLTPLDNIEKGCWVSVQQPTKAEIDFLVNDLGVNSDFIETSLDENERSHIEVRDSQTLIVFDMPIEIPVRVEGVPEFYTIPVGFVMTEDYTISLISLSSPIIQEVSDGKIPTADTNNPNQLVFSIIYHISHHFIMHLDNIDKIAFKVELKLQTSMKNEELVQILSLQKSLVYFTTSLKSTEATLEKILRGRAVRINDYDQDLLEDTIIEIKQSIETASVYTAVLASTMDAVSSIVSNNMNMLMKVLTSITLVLSIPNIIFGFYGMNVNFSSESIHFFIPLGITVFICIVCAWLLYINDFF